MMLSHYNINSPIVFDEDHVNVLVIENPTQLSKIVEELILQSEGKNGGFTLSDKNELLPIFGNIITLIDPFSLVPNEREILNRLYSHMKNDALDEDCYLNVNEMISTIEKELEHIMLRQPVQLERNDIDIMGLIKLANIHFEVSGPLIERIYDYVTICKEYRRIKIFIFVNFKSYLTVEEIIQLYSFAQYQKIHILMIETHQSEILCQEKIRIIDIDLCEFGNEEEKPL
jgi:CRISPR type II-A/NMEMI-associated protein Csn2